jgi:hypothetical protein
MPAMKSILGPVLRAHLSNQNNQSNADSISMGESARFVSRPSSSNKPISMIED